ncbi:hypothetical protein MW887_005032 [Aspergillus wentii]|nr:hypothetical protein MW887_005032 [Aspergillus wentii]
MDKTSTRQPLPDQASRGPPNSDSESNTSTSSGGSEDDKKASSGDGICPTLEEFDACRQMSYDAWKLAALSCTPKLSSSIDISLDKLSNVPRFYHNPPQNIHVGGRSKSPLILKLSFQLETTHDDSCDRRWKSIDYLQCIGFPLSMIPKLRPSDSVIPSSPRAGYLTSITLAWSYIISCRWVEILQSAGETCVLYSKDIGFWERVTQSCWSAQITRGKKGWFCPWMLQPETIDNDQRSDWVQTPPDSALAFDILLEFCTSEQLEDEFLIGFATVLLLTSRNMPLPKMEPPTNISRPVANTRSNPKLSKLFEYLDKYMTLSATQDALESLLCNEEKPANYQLAEEQSWIATSRLFNWHRYYDDGLWLDDGTHNIEHIRHLLQHPWIVDPFDDDESIPLDKVERPNPRESILEWIAQVTPSPDI